MADLNWNKRLCTYTNMYIQQQPQTLISKQINKRIEMLCCLHILTRALSSHWKWVSMSSVRSIHRIRIVNLMRISWVEYGQKHYHHFNDTVNFNGNVCMLHGQCDRTQCKKVPSLENCAMWDTEKKNNKTLAHHTNDHFDVFPFSALFSFGHESLLIFFNWKIFRITFQCCVFG